MRSTGEGASGLRSTGRALRLGLGVLLVCAGWGGCSRAGEVLTADLEGRRVQRFEVDGTWMAYVWSGANTRSAPTQLVVRNLASGAETVLATEWSFGDFTLDAGRVAWANGQERDGEGRMPVRLYDVAAGTTEPLFTARVGSLDLAGDTLVYEQRDERAARVMLADLATGGVRQLSPEGDGPGTYHRDPATDGSTVAWTRSDGQRREFRLFVHDLAGEATTPTSVVHPKNFEVRLADGFIVYTAGPRTRRAVYVYDVARGTAQKVAESARLKNVPALDGGIVAWTEHVAADEFKPVPGQRLIGASDFIHLFRYDVYSRKTRQIATGLYRTGSACLDVQDGQVYCTVERNLTPPGVSNLVVPVDVRRW